MSTLMDNARELMKNAQQTSNDAVLAVLKMELESFFEGLEDEMLQQAEKGFPHVRICISKALWLELSTEPSELWWRFNRRLNAELGMDKSNRHSGGDLDTDYGIFELKMVEDTYYVVIKIEN